MEACVLLPPIFVATLRGFRDLLKSYPVNDAGLGALIGRIGSSDVSQAFSVGAKKELQIRRVGEYVVRSLEDAGLVA